MTLAAFLEWEERQELRYEFDGVEPVAMAGGSLAHAAIQRNLALALGSRLRGKPCQFFGSDLKIQAAENSSRYPDGMVICSPVLIRPLKIVRNPVVVLFEVLSPSTPPRSTASSRRANIRPPRLFSAMSCSSRPELALPSTFAPRTDGASSS